MSSMNQVTVNLSDDELSSLTALADRSRSPNAWLGRQAIRELLERTQRDRNELPIPLSGTERIGGTVRSHANEEAKSTQGRQI